MMKSKQSLYSFFCPEYTIIGKSTQKRQLKIITAVAFLSVIMITGITATSLFDQKADALKKSVKKFDAKGADGWKANTGGNKDVGGKGAAGAKGGSATGANGGSGNTGVSSGGGGSGGPVDPNPGGA